MAMFSCGYRRIDRVESVRNQTLPFVLNNECRVHVSLLLVAEMYGCPETERAILW